MCTIQRDFFNNIQEISQIENIVHDQSFDIEEIHLKKDILSIKFKKEYNDKKRLKHNLFFYKKVIIPYEKCFLNIYNVKDYKIIDSEKIGIYDFNSINYIENMGKIIINTTIPIFFEINVSKLEIEIVKTGIIIEEKVNKKLF
jgi:hypothetical protein